MGDRYSVDAAAEVHSLLSGGTAISAPETPPAFDSIPHSPPSSDSEDSGAIHEQKATHSNASAGPSSAIHRWPDGAEYEGEWMHGFMHGHGTYTAANGDVYEGSFVRGLKHGYGTQTVAADGSRFQGMWENGREHGQGCYCKGGMCFVGQYVFGVIKGNGVHSWSDGSSFSGYHRNGQVSAPVNWRSGYVKTAEGNTASLTADVADALGTCACGTPSVQAHAHESQASPGTIGAQPPASRDLKTTAAGSHKSEWGRRRAGQVDGCQKRASAEVLKASTTSAELMNQATPALSTAATPTTTATTKTFFFLAGFPQKRVSASADSPSYTWNPGGAALAPPSKIINKMTMDMTRFHAGPGLSVRIKAPSPIAGTECQTTAVS